MFREIADRFVDEMLLPLAFVLLILFLLWILGGLDDSIYKRR